MGLVFNGIFRCCKIFKTKTSRIFSYLVYFSKYQTKPRNEQKKNPFRKSSRPWLKHRKKDKLNHNIFLMHNIHLILIFHLHSCSQLLNWLKMVLKTKFDKVFRFCTLFIFFNSPASCFYVKLCRKILLSWTWKNRKDINLTANIHWKLV